VCKTKNRAPVVVVATAKVTEDRCLPPNTVIFPRSRVGPRTFGTAVVWYVPLFFSLGFPSSMHAILSLILSRRSIGGNKLPGTCSLEATGIVHRARSKTGGLLPSRRLRTLTGSELVLFQKKEDRAGSKSGRAEEESANKNATEIIRRSVDSSRTAPRPSEAGQPERERCLRASGRHFCKIVLESAYG
jgi:hypothetical protein